MPLISLGVTLKINYLYIFIIFLFFAYAFPNKSLPKEPKFEYQNEKEFIVSLNNCADYLERNINKSVHIPRSIMLAQAIIESNYGTSRFAIQGNNLFGVMTFNLEEPHLKPFKNKKSKFGARKYETKCQSVKHYIQVLNTGSAFIEFRELREKMLKHGILTEADVIILSGTLSKYAENKDYVNLVRKTIKSLNKNH